MSNKETKKPEVKPVVAKALVYKVAEGKTITSKKGILEAGCEVKAKLLSGGEKALKCLLDAGCIVKA